MDENTGLQIGGGVLDKYCMAKSFYMHTLDGLWTVFCIQSAWI